MVEEAGSPLVEYERLRRLVEEPDGDASVLDRLCRVALGELDLLAASVTLPPQGDAHVVAASSGVTARRLEELQLDLGEGPTRDACTTRRPLVVHDLAATGIRRWPGFAPAAAGVGASAVYSFPLLVGAALLGALTLYRAGAGALPAPRVRLALALSALATDLVVDGALDGPSHPTGAPTHDGSALGREIDGQAQIYQAQGMVMVRLGVALPEALARMRAHAYANGLSLAALSAEIVAGRASLHDDRDPP